MSRKILELEPVAPPAKGFIAFESESSAAYIELARVYRGDLGNRSLAFWRQYARVEGYKLIED